jgi:hypothetical protein
MKGVTLMQETIKNYLEGFKIGRKQSHKNLAMFPVLSTYFLDLDYLLLDEALAAGVIEIVEVAKDGHVPELRVINNSPDMILILDGEELVGAKQNRIVNTTILVQGDTTIIIPVSCVESGRWTYNSPSFSSKERLMSYSLRAMKSEQVKSSLRSSGNYRSDQGEIWHEISEKAKRRKAESPGMAMGEIYEKDKPSIDEYIKHFSLIDLQVGAVFMINGKIVGMDTFGKPDSFSKVFRKLVESYALDAVDWLEPEKEYHNRKGDVTQFMANALGAETESRPSIGLGTDLRMESKEITGFALALDEKILHLSVFAMNGSPAGKTYSRMKRYSRRRQNRV